MNDEEIKNTPETLVVYQQKMCAERRRCSVKDWYTNRWVTHKGSFATQNKTYINSTTIYVKSMGSSARICVPFTDVVQKMHFHIQQ